MATIRVKVCRNCGWAYEPTDETQADGLCWRCLASRENPPVPGAHRIDDRGMVRIYDGTRWLPADEFMGKYLGPWLAKMRESQAGRDVVTITGVVADASDLDSRYDIRLDGDVSIYPTVLLDVLNAREGLRVKITVEVLE